ncbi:MAG: redoxin domain-containing protein [Victivallales bacterium]|jgi:peroxiredoxin|nr:redoxin domain-containing protein [Victivallales bacterium]
MSKFKFIAITLIVFTFFCGAYVRAASLPVSAAATGAVVPELEVVAWPQGKAVKLNELRGKKFAVLFFWTISEQGTKNFAEIAKISKEFESKDVVFIGIGIDSAESIGNFVRLKELPFSVAADDKLSSVNFYMRERDRVPMAAIIDKEGRLVWRGLPTLLPKVLPEVIEGKYDLKGSIERENFSKAVMVAMKIQDYPSVLKLLDAELLIYPDNMELLNFKVRLLGTLMKEPDKALACLDEVIARQPKNIKLYEMGLKILRDEKRFADLGKWFDRIIKEFGEQPLLLVKFAQQEMNQSIEQLRLENAYNLCRAAYNAPKFKNNREKGFIMGEYARSLYYCGRPDKALEVSKEAMVLLKDTPEYEKAKSYVTYYNKVLTLSRQIQ